MAKNNDLNLKIESEVITLAGMLDITKTVKNINKQITALNKNNEALKKLKLDVKLNLSIKNLNTQIATFQKLLNNTKTFKPLTMDVKFRFDGATDKLKSELGGAEKTLNNFGRTLKASSKSIKNSTNEINKSIKGIKLKDGLGNMSVEASKFGKEIEKVKKDVTKTFGGKNAGVFSFKEVKDGQGNLNGLVATLTKTNGIINTMSYSWDANSKKLIPVKQTTVNENEKNVNKAITSLKRLEAEMHRLENGSIKTNLFKQYNKLIKQADSGTLKFDSVKTLDDRIKKEQMLQGVMQRTDTMTAKNVKTIDNLKNSINRLGDGSEKNRLTKELENLSKQTKMTKTDVANLNKEINAEKKTQQNIAKENGLYEKQQKLIADTKKARKELMAFDKDASIKDYTNITKSVKNDGSEKNIIKQRKELEKLNESLKERKALDKQNLSNSVKELNVTKQLRALQQKTTGDSGSEYLIQRARDLAKVAKTEEDWLKVRKKIDEVDKRQNNLKSANKIDKLQTQAQNRLIKLKNLGGLTEELFTRNMDSISYIASKGYKTLNTYYDNLGKKLETSQKKMNALADRNKTVLSGEKVNGVSNTSNIKKAIDTGDIASLQKYIGELYKSKVETIKVESATNKLGQAVSRLKVQFAGTGKTVNTATIDLLRHNNALMQTAQGSVYNANRNLGVFEQLKIAMSRVPVWMVAMTAFYSSVNAVSSAVNKIIEIDTLMTNINRVSSDSVNLDHLFNGAVDMSTKLGNNLSDILTSLGDFSRTFGEFNERQLLAITQTATLMSNVSELTAQESTQNLVGTMNAFNITAEDSIRIVDSLNEVDNNYAISTKQLAEGLSRSASTAKTFGSSMEDTIGHITAIGSVTMESGSVIGNSLKTIYSRITTMSGAEEALNDVGVAIYKIGENGEKQIKPVSDIIRELASVWHDLSNEQQQHLTVTVAGRYQLNRFSALMNNFDVATQSTSTALYSQGSAMRENAKYLESFEARLNKMKNSFSQLALAVGDAFLADGMFVVIEGLKSIANSASFVFSKIGVLPPLFLLLYGVLSKFGVLKMIGTSFTNLATTLGKAKVAMNATRASMLSTQASAVAMSTTSSGAFRTMAISAKTAGATIVGAMNGIKLALKSLLASTGIGLAFIAVGGAIEYFTNKSRKATEESEKLQESIDKMVGSYRSMGMTSGLNEMIDKYSVLLEKSDKTNNEVEEMNLLHSQLANSMDGMVDYIDSQGVAHLKNTEEMREQVELAEKLSKAQAKITVAEFKTDTSKNKKEYNEMQKKIEKAQKKLDKIVANDGKEFDGIILDNTIEIAKKEAEIVSLKQDLIQSIKDTKTVIKQASLAYLEQDGNLSSLSDSQKKVIENVIDMNEEFLRTENNSVSSQEKLKDLAVSYGEAFVDAKEKVVSALSESLAPKEKLEEMDKINLKFNQIAKAIPKDLLVLDKNGNLKITAKELGDIVTELYKIDSADGIDTLIKQLTNLGIPLDTAQQLVRNLGKEMANSAIQAKVQQDGIEDLTDQMNDYVEAVIDARDLTKEIFGYSKSDLSAIQTNLQLLDIMEKKYGDIAKESEEYKKVISEIGKIIGATDDYVMQNRHTIEAYAEEIQKIDLMTLYDYQSWEQFIDSLEIADFVKKALKEAKGDIDVFTGEASEKLKITVTDGEIKIVSEGVSKATEETQKLNSELKEVKKVLTENISEDFSQTFRNNINSLKDDMYVVKDEAGNLKLQFTEDGRDSSFINSINQELEIMGGKLNIVENDLGELELLVTKDGESLLIGKLNESLVKTNEKLNETKDNLDQTKEKAQEFGETDISPTIDTDFKKLTNEAEGVYNTMEKLDEAFVKLDENVQKMGAIETVLEGLKNFINDIKDGFDAIFGNKTDFEGLKQTVQDTTKAVSDLKNAIENIKNLSGQISIGGFEKIQEEVELTINNVDRLKKSMEKISDTTDGINIGGLPQVNALMNTLNLISDSITSLSKSFSDMRAKGIKDIETLSRNVVSNSNAMINKHVQQKIAIENLAKSATDAKKEISLLNSIAGSASNSVKSYQIDAYNTLDSLMPHLIANSSSYDIGANKAVNGHYTTNIQSLSANSSTSEGGSTSTSTGVGTSGTVKQSYNRAIGLNGQSVLYATGVQSETGKPSPSNKKPSKNKNKNTSTSKNKLDNLYIRDWYEMTADGFSANLSLFKAQLEGLKEGSEQYRSVLKKILVDENHYLYVISAQMKYLNSRNSAIGTRLSQLSNTSKHTVAQREEYNELLKEFEANEKKIQSLRTEITSATIELKNTAQNVMQDVVTGILNTFELTLTAITKRISNIDFKLQVLEITDPENLAEKMGLMADKVREMANEQQNYNNAIKELESKLLEASTKYGKDSDIVKKMTSELEGLQDAWKNTYLEILKTEREIKQMRIDISDDIINELKSRYEKMSKAEVEAKDKELKALKKLHKEKMSFYDDEIKKIKELYDARIRLLDDKADEDDYQEELTEKNEKLTKLQNEKFLLSGDDSLEGKKRFKEKEQEIADLQKEIDKFVLQRQRELTKQQLQDQRDYEVEQIEGTKDRYDKEMEIQEEAIEKEKDLITEKYDSIIADEERWSKIRNELIKGNFSLLNKELGDMGISIKQHSNGIFDTLAENFKTYSQEVQNFVNKINGMVGNINNTSGFNIGSLGNTSPEGIINTNNSIRGQDIPFIIQKSKNGIKMDISTPEKDYLYNLIKDSNISESFMQHIWKKALSNTALDVPTPEKMMFYNLFQEIIKKNKLKSFDTGGYTGSWGSSGKLAMLHEKELVLNKNQTEDILNIVKLMNKMSIDVPKINRISSIPTNTSNVSNGDNIEINVNIESFGGSKSDANNLGKDILNILKKTGRK